MPHILREVGAAWLQDTGDLVPAHADRMTAHYQVKGGVAEGQVSDGVIHSHHADAQGCEITPRYLDVRRPRFRRHQDRRRGRYRRQDLTAARLKVERCRIGHLGQLSHPLAKHSRVTPRWPLLHGAALKPGEIPAVHWHGRAFRHEIIKAGHARIRLPRPCTYDQDGALQAITRGAPAPEAWRGHPSRLPVGKGRLFRGRNEPNTAMAGVPIRAAGFPLYAEVTDMLRSLTMQRQTGVTSGWR